MMDALPLLHMEILWDSYTIGGDPFHLPSRPGFFDSPEGGRKGEGWEEGWVRMLRIQRFRDSISLSCYEIGQGLTGPVESGRR